MDLEFAYSILDIFQTMWDIAKQIEKNYFAKNEEAFNSLCMDLWDGLIAVQEVAREKLPENGKIRLVDACTCAMESLKDIKMLSLLKPEKIEWKLAYELEPIIETAATQFYYWSIVAENPEKGEEFRKFLEDTEAFGLMKEEPHTYLYDLIIQVTGYNHLDYTMKCVQSIFENLPRDIKTEILLFNHGSNDDTKRYFESIENARVINVAVNRVMPCVTNKAISRGKYCLFVSNDIVFGTNAIENLYRCAVEHDNYGYIVPTTPAVSNLQTIYANYENWGQFKEFVQKNNIYDTKRHEERVRLCNPLNITPSVLWEKMTMEMYEDKCCNWGMFSFQDDKISLWMRRHNYRNILAKDSYCHHFGSVTVKNDTDKIQKQEQLYKEGRKEFNKRYNIDPWGTGFCYDQQLFNAWNIKSQDGISVLGLNCGLGSNSLKVKEVLKEKGARGITLYNGTQNKKYLEDLNGISDYAFEFSKISDIVAKTGKKNFYYIIVDDIIQGVAPEELMQKIRDAEIIYNELVYRRADGQWEIVNLLAS